MVTINTQLRWKHEQLCKVTHRCKLLRLVPGTGQVGSLQNRKSQNLVNFNWTWNAILHVRQTTLRNEKIHNLHTVIRDDACGKMNKIARNRLRGKKIDSYAESRTAASCCGRCRSLSRWATYESHRLSIWSIETDNATQWYIRQITRSITWQHYLNRIWMRTLQTTPGIKIKFNQYCSVYFFLIRVCRTTNNCQSHFTEIHTAQWTR